MHSNTSQKLYKALLLVLIILSYTSGLFSQIAELAINLDDLPNNPTSKEIAVVISKESKQTGNVKIPIVLTSKKGISYAFINVESKTYIENPDKKHSINSKGDNGLLHFIVHEKNLSNKQRVRYLHVTFTAFPNGIGEKGITYTKKIKLQYICED
ncbi:MAG: hypothetical protein AB8E82_19690 [Aureispira sp.]